MTHAQYFSLFLRSCEFHHYEDGRVTYIMVTKPHAAPFGVKFIPDETGGGWCECAPTHQSSAIVRFYKKARHVE